MKTKTKIGIAVTFAILLAAVFAGILYYEYGYGNAWQNFFGAEEAVFSGQLLELEPGESAALSFSVKPAYANKHSVLVASSNPEVVTVEDGKLKARREGTAVITAAGKDASSQMTVTVKLREGSLTLNRTELSLSAGEKTVLSAQRYLLKETVANPVFTSSNEAVASVSDSGEVTAKQIGTAEITVSADGKLAYCTVEVVLAPTSVSLGQRQIRVSVGQSLPLSYTVEPEGASTKRVRWSTSDASVAEVHDGTLMAVGTGSCTITAKAGNHAESMRVTVLKTDLVVKLSQTSLTLKAGEHSKLDVTIMTPSNTVKNEPAWASSNSSVVSVDKTGALTANNKGTAFVSVKTDVGEALCKVTVA